MQMPHRKYDVYKLQYLDFIKASWELVLLLILVFLASVLIAFDCISSSIRTLKYKLFKTALNLNLPDDPEGCKAQGLTSLFFFCRYHPHGRICGHL